MTLEDEEKDMDAPNVARDTAENLSEGINCLYALVIAKESDFESSPVLSKMRDALSLMREGARFYSPRAVVDDAMIQRLDAILEKLGGVGDGSVSQEIRDQARALLADIEVKWGVKLPDPQTT